MLTRPDRELDRIVVRFPKEMMARLRAEAEATCTPMAVLIREGVDAHLRSREHDRRRT